MKQIILIRHAKVDMDNSQKITSVLLKSWVDAYDVADIHPESLPPQELIDLVESSSVVLTSSLKRAIDTAKVLGIDIYEQNTVFNEAKIPDVGIPLLKFKPKRWLVILRVLSLFGLGKKGTSLKASKIQAQKAVIRLEELSEEYDTIVLVGHGGMNWFIRKVLMRKGWSLQPNASNKNWGMTILEEIKG